MKVKLDGEWKQLAKTEVAGKGHDGGIELTLYQTEKLTRFEILYWRGEAIECNFVVTTTDWKKAFDMLDRLSKDKVYIGELSALALSEALGTTEATKLLHDLDEATPTTVMG